jgi:hypothetical protein
LDTYQHKWKVPLAATTTNPPENTRSATLTEQQKTISHESFDLVAMTVPWSQDHKIFILTVEVAAIQTMTRETQVLTLPTLLGVENRDPLPHPPQEWRRGKELVASQVEGGEN